MIKVALWQIAKVVYKLILRKIIFDAIDNPDKEIDDVVLRALDALFNYKQDGK